MLLLLLFDACSDLDRIYFEKKTNDLKTAIVKTIVALSVLFRLLSTGTFMAQVFSNSKTGSCHPWTPELCCCYEHCPFISIYQFYNKWPMYFLFFFQKFTNPTALWYPWRMTSTFNPYTSARPPPS